MPGQPQSVGVPQYVSAATAIEEIAAAPSIQMVSARIADQRVVVHGADQRLNTGKGVVPLSHGSPLGNEAQIPLGLS